MPFRQLRGARVKAARSAVRGWRSLAARRVSPLLRRLTLFLTMRISGGACDVGLGYASLSEFASAETSTSQAPAVQRGLKQRTCTFTTASLRMSFACSVRTLNLTRRSLLFACLPCASASLASPIPRLRDQPHQDALLTATHPQCLSTHYRSPTQLTLPLSIVALLRLLAGMR